MLQNRCSTNSWQPPFNQLSGLFNGETFCVPERSRNWTPFCCLAIDFVVPRMPLGEETI